MHERAAGPIAWMKPFDSLGAEIRDMLRRDMPRVLDIERAGFAHPWDEAEFHRACKLTKVRAMTAALYEPDPDDTGLCAVETVIGFMVFELGTRAVELMNLAVAPEFRRRSVGRKMIDYLSSYLSEKRPRIVANVWERNVDAQLWFRALGFRAVRILPGEYEDGSEAWQFARRWRPAEAAALATGH
ncbi:MAG: GNAT family N-acetyltransferase [Pirellulales bacterium]|nr:GNAT family N-acetyltransferase [Pirellulales bacterium]